MRRNADSRPIDRPRGTLHRHALGLAIGTALVASISTEAQAQAFPPVVQLSALAGTTGFKIDGEAMFDRSGFSVSAAGDINGDGIDDLIIGARGAYATNGGSSGRSYVVFGRDVDTQGGFASPLQLSALDGSNGFMLDGEAAYDSSGISVSAAGDINGDGIDDLIVGAVGARPNGISSGRSYVVFGRDVATQGGFTSPMQLSSIDGSNGFKLDGEVAGDQSGNSVSAAGDINGDGVDDLIVGAWGADPNGSYSGRSYVVFGSSSGFVSPLQLAALDGSNGFKLDGEVAFDRSGFSVSAAGDINGDGVDDLIVGAWSADPNGNYSGRSYVVFGRNVATQGGFTSPMQLSSLDGSNGFKLDGEAVYDQSGRSVSAAGDINGDGVDDLIVSAHYADPNGNVSGRSYVIFGRNVATQGGFTSPLQLSAINGANGFKLDGEAAGDQAGVSVSAAGDINGDGIDDLIVGALGADPNGGGSGRSYVVFGNIDAFAAPLQLSALDGSNGFKLDGEALLDFSGSSVSAAGDINGDGIDDLIVGAYGAEPNGSFSGRSYVVFGRINGTPVLDFGGMKLIDFGGVEVGAASATQTLTLSSPGTALVRIDAITLANPSFAIAGGSCGPLPIRIRVNEFCTLELAFAPQAEGFALAEMIFTGTSVSSPDSVTLFGAGLPAPMVSLLPDPLDFGDVALNSQTMETLIVENTGAGTLAPGAVTISGAQAGEFSIAMNNCSGAQLAQDEFCGIDIGFAPTAPGIRQATLQLESNAPSSPDFVALRGSNDVVFADGFEGD